jgi:hypothetical protein
MLLEQLSFNRFNKKRGLFRHVFRFLLLENLYAVKKLINQFRKEAAKSAGSFVELAIGLSLSPGQKRLAASWSGLF